MKKLILLVAIATTLVSFNSYSQSLSEVLNNNATTSKSFNLAMPTFASPSTPKVNTNLNAVSSPKSNKKKTLTGMSIKELSNLHAPKRTGFEAF